MPMSPYIILKPNKTRPGGPPEAGCYSKIAELLAGDQLPVWKPFPSQFPVALEQEIDARKHAGIVH